MQKILYKKSNIFILKYALFISVWLLKHETEKCLSRHWVMKYMSVMFWPYFLFHLCFA